MITSVGPNDSGRGLDTRVKESIADADVGVDGDPNCDAARTVIVVSSSALVAVIAVADVLEMSSS